MLKRSSLLIDFDNNSNVKLFLKLQCYQINISTRKFYSRI